MVRIPIPYIRNVHIDTHILPFVTQFEIFQNTGNVRPLLEHILGNTRTDRGAVTNRLLRKTLTTFGLVRVTGHGRGAQYSPGPVLQDFLIATGDNGRRNAIVRHVILSGGWALLYVLQRGQSLGTPLGEVSDLREYYSQAFEYSVNENNTYTDTRRFYRDTGVLDADNVTVDIALIREISGFDLDDISSFSRLSDFSQHFVCALLALGSVSTETARLTREPPGIHDYIRDTLGYTDYNQNLVLQNARANIDFQRFVSFYKNIDGLDDMSYKDIVKLMREHDISTDGTGTGRTDRIRRVKYSKPSIGSGNWYYHLASNEEGLNAFLASELPKRLIGFDETVLDDILTPLETHLRRVLRINVTAPEKAQHLEALGAHLLFRYGLRNIKKRDRTNLGEIDVKAIREAPQFSQWAVQCKHQWKSGQNPKPMGVRDMASELALAEQSSVDTVLILSMGGITTEAQGLRYRWMTSKPMSILVMDGTFLQTLKDTEDKDRQNILEKWLTDSMEEVQRIRSAVAAPERIWGDMMVEWHLGNTEHTSETAIEEVIESMDGFDLLSRHLREAFEEAWNRRMMEN